MPKTCSLLQQALMLSLQSRGRPQTLPGLASITLVLFSQRFQSQRSFLPLEHPA